jgi:hypothetical protein
MLAVRVRNLKRVYNTRTKPETLILLERSIVLEFYTLIGKTKVGKKESVDVISVMLAEGNTASMRDEGSNPSPIPN